ncbi:MarR family winged helix-turn-helix transcriptional regulator [Alkalicella caledoniensis]|uniref:MarR family winged helix-turn-helix transcriptional regulator n=1 Tax=Alkalicella caledoniensis TaxID=2731377 RepID=UPI001FE5823E|nr:MarR family transcriptional regulator [Alkalicella caledoniensis]
MQDKEIARLFFSFLIHTKNYAKGHFTLSSTSPLTDTQFKTLIVLKRLKKVSLKKLSEELSVSNSSLSIMLNKLVDDGWVHRAFDNTDRRSTFFSLTQKGNELIDAEVNQKLDVIAERILTVPDNEKQVIVDSINTLQTFISTISK